MPSQKKAKVKKISLKKLNKIKPVSFLPALPAANDDVPAPVAALVHETVTVGQLEVLIEKVDRATVVIRRPADQLLTKPANVNSPYLQKKPKAIKTLAGLEKRLAVFGLKPEDYVGFGMAFY